MGAIYNDIIPGIFFKQLFNDNRGLFFFFEEFRIFFGKKIFT